MYTQEIAVHKLTSKEREALSLLMYPLQAQVFAGVDYDTFRNYVVDSTAWRTWIYLHHSEQGEVVGYLALHTFRKVINGKRRQIFRMETGKLPAFRGKDMTVLRAMGRMLVHSLSGLRYESFFFASMVYPSSYAMAAKYAPRVWPTYTQQTPADKEALLFELASVFKLRVVSDQAPLVRQVGWITREPGKKITWSPTINPHAVYFTEMNPSYDQGHGLLTLVPAAIWDICQAALHFVVSRGKRLLQLPRTDQPIAHNYPPCSALKMRLAKSSAMDSTSVCFGTQENERTKTS